jgi:hypothetical protein
MQTTGNTSNLVRQQIYSDVLLSSFDEVLMNQTLFRDYTADFPDGDTLNIDQIGDILWTPYAENTEVDYSAIDTSRLTLTVTDYNQDGFYITDKLKQDSWKADMLFSERINLSAKRYEQDIQTAIFAAANAGQTASDENKINGYAHRVAADGGVFNIQDLSFLKLAFDKANVPANGRVFFCDATVENTLNNLTNLVAVTNNIHFEGIVTTGFAKDHKFLANIYGFDVWVTNLLPRITSETVNDRGGVDETFTSGIVNVAMCLQDEDVMPLMGVLREVPSPEFERNAKKKRDEWSVTERHGFGLQRPESLATLITGTVS